MRTEVLYEFIIGESLQIYSNFSPLKVNIAEYFPIYLEDYVDYDNPSAYLFNAHDCSFKVTKTNNNDRLNSLVMTLFNLDDDVVDYLSTNSGNNLVAILRVGDNEVGLSKLFQGTVTKVKDDNSNTDRVTTITVSDGKVNTQNAFSLRTYDTGTPRKTILADLIKDTQLPIGTTVEVEGNILRPKSLQGKTMDLIDKLFVMDDLDVSIQDGNIEVINKRYRKDEQVAYISMETGLIGKPSPLVKDASSTKDNVSANSSGVRFQGFLDTSVRPNATVYLKDGKFDGAYKVTNVVYTGSTRKNNWMYKAEGIETQGVISQ